MFVIFPLCADKMTSTFEKKKKNWQAESFNAQAKMTWAVNFGRFASHVLAVISFLCLDILLVFKVNFEATLEAFFDR